MFEQNTKRAIVAQYNKACRKVRKQWRLWQSVPQTPTGLSLPEFLAWQEGNAKLYSANEKRHRVITRHSKTAFRIEYRYLDVSF